MNKWFNIFKKKKSKVIVHTNIWYSNAFDRIMDVKSFMDVEKIKGWHDDKNMKWLYFNENYLSPSYTKGIDKTCILGELVTDYLFECWQVTDINNNKKEYLERIDNPEPTEELKIFLREDKLKRILNGKNLL